MNPKLKAGLRLLSVILLALTGEEAIAHGLGMPGWGIALLGLVSGALVTLGYGPKPKAVGPALVLLLALAPSACAHTSTIRETVTAASVGTALARDTLGHANPQTPEQAKAVEDAEAILAEVARLLGDLDRLAPILDEIVGERAPE